METETFVYVDLQGQTHFVGRLWTRQRSERESASFEYDRNWLSNPASFSMQPSMVLGPGPFHTGNRSFAQSRIPSYQ